MASRPEGLSGAEAATRLAEVGQNALAEARRVSPLTILVRQFTGFLVVVLIVAAGIAWALGEVVDTIAISLVVVLNGALGFVQEWRAETAIAALRDMLSDTARVVRDGRAQRIDTRAIVPGDVVLLETGDRVPADMDLATAVQVKADESVLTGESLPVERAEGERLFMGTTLVAGRAEGVVTATGPRTEFGQIATLTGSVGDKRTNLQRQLGRLARQMGLAAVALGAFVGGIGLIAGRAPAEMFMTGLSLAVAIVPEGLPAVVTITLALGASAMVRQKALARRLQAVETLGAASVICTDKTGTLTENMMTAARVWTPGAVYEATGTGYDPAGHIRHEGRKVRHGDDPTLTAILDVAIACTHAALHRADGGWHMVGEPTEGALVTLAWKGWAPLPDPDDILWEAPFTSERKRMSVIARTDAGREMRTKGAPEQVLEVCTHVAGREGARALDAPAREEILAAYREMAADGLRVIAFARKAAGEGPVSQAREDGLTFLGLAGLIDPPRPEVRAALAACRSAGIRVLMITGDSPDTATVIARQLGLGTRRILTGPEVDGLDDAALTRALERPVLFARVAPAHKMRIVEALQARGQIVAMTGDGVNDAPALKRADIGVAMGTRGTDVAKDAADLVLLDDNFATIVRAILEGRRQFSNVQKFVRYLLASNAGEVVALVANILMGGPLIFLATQILWMNLVTDGVTAVALGQMKRPPRPKSQGILGLPGLGMILAFGAYTGAASLFVFTLFLPQGEVVARTAAFTAMVVFEKVSVFAFRSFSAPNWRVGWTSNRVLLAALVSMLGAQAAAVYWPPLQTLLRTEALGLAHWGWIAALAVPLVAVPEAIKTLRARSAG